MDDYTYNDLNQLVELKQGQYIYQYKYDAQKERISQTKTDIKMYSYEDWYEYREQIALMNKKEVKEAFGLLKSQAMKSDENMCSNLVVDSNEVRYKKKSEDTKLILDRNREYTEVLKDDVSIYVYGEQLLQSNTEDIVNGLNDSVIAKVNGNKIEKISYNDYGYTEDIKKGKGYNGETLDETGLIYLRARYYDPTISRFIQIDNNYAGEKDIVATQNRYVYSLSNPYKYVDRDGNKAKKKKTDKVVEVSTQRQGNSTIYTTRYQSGKTTTIEVRQTPTRTVYWTGKKPDIYDNEPINEVRKKQLANYAKPIPIVECLNIRELQKGTLAGAGTDFVEGFINFFVKLPENIDNSYKAMQPMRDNFSNGLSNILKDENTWKTLKENLQTIKYDMIFNLLSSNDFDEFARKYGYKNASEALGEKSGELAFVYLIGKGFSTVSNSTTGGIPNKGASGAKFGDNFGKMGTYTEKPNLKVDWKQYADHATNDSMVKRGITQEMVDSYVANGKALSQGNGKYAFVSRDGVAVVASNGKLVTTWSSANFDANMLEIIDKLFGKGK